MRSISATTQPTTIDDKIETCDPMHKNRTSMMQASTFLLSICLVTALLACGLFGDTQKPVSTENATSESQAGPASAPAHTGSAASVVGYSGPMSLEERILVSPVIARVRLDSVSSNVEFGSTVRGDEYIAVMEFSFTVLEYLKGNGGNNIVAVWDGAQLFLTREEAEAALPTVVAARDSQWDDREAIVFLKHSQTYLTSTQQAGRFYLSPELDVHPDDNYSLSSRYSKLWLPAESHSQPSGDQQQFLLDVPPSTGMAPTITLGEMKDRIATVTAKLNAGDGSPEYAECVRRTYWYEGMDRYSLETRGHSLFVETPDHELDSGLAASTIVYEDSDLGGLPNKRDELWLDGGDAELFGVKFGNAVPFDFSGDGVNDSIQYDRRVVSARPIPEGVYKFHINDRNDEFVPCEGFTIRYEWTVTVISPTGTLHELFFDPVTAAQGQSGPAKVAADASNGVLEPASFTDANGASATIQSVSYEPPSGGSGQSGADSESGTGTVAMKLTTHTGLANHALDFIALDGSVSLSLVADDATVDDANNTLSWTVAEQPWHGGDKLMLRIRKTLPAPEDVSVSLSGGTYTISWSAVTGAADYRAQYRTGGSEADWTDLDATTGTSQTFSPEGGVACSTTYEFRVQARGDGTTYPAEWSPLSESTSHTNSAGACNRPPVFDSATYTFTVSEDASVWPDSHVVGTLSASDPDQGDSVLYYITAGNGAGAFNISSGHDEADILVWAALDYETTSSYTLTVEARDGKAGGTSSATVEISVTDVAE